MLRWKRVQSRYYTVNSSVLDQVCCNLEKRSCATKMEKRQISHKQITCVPWLGNVKTTSVIMEITKFIPYLHLFDVDKFS